MVTTYSLSDYTFTLSVNPDQGTSILGNETKYSIGGNAGGEGSFLGNISVKIEGTPWTTQADATGSWVHEFSYDRHGTASLKIRQVSDDVIRLAGICNYYYSNSKSSLNITITGGGRTIATCTDCYLSKIPDQNFGSTTEEQEWIFTCGKIVIEGSNA